MDVTYLLILLLFGAIATFLSGDKWASKVALLSSVTAFAGAICLLSRYNLGQEINYLHLWISKPNIYFALQADGLALADGKAFAHFLDLQIQPARMVAHKGAKA